MPRRVTIAMAEPVTAAYICQFPALRFRASVRDDERRVAKYAFRRWFRSGFRVGPLGYCGHPGSRREPTKYLGSRLARRETSLAPLLGFGGKPIRIVCFPEPTENTIAEVFLTLRDWYSGEL